MIIRLKKKIKRKIPRKPTKKVEGRESSQNETESDGEVSHHSLTGSLTRSVFSSKVYTADDIKHFLKVTKNVRRVKIEEFFPDISPFIDKVKVFRKGESVF